MQTLPATEALVPQFSYELKMDAARLSGSVEEAAMPGSDAGMDALLSAWTAVFQQQIMPQPEEALAGEVRFDAVDSANGEGMKAASSKQALSLQSELSSTTGFLGSITAQAAIIWQQVPMLMGLTNDASTLKSEQEMELPEVSAEFASARLPCTKANCGCDSWSARDRHRCSFANTSRNSVSTRFKF